MRFKGKKLDSPKPKYVAIPRDTMNDKGEVVTQDIVFQCDAVLKWDEFNQLCPPPKAPNVFNVKKGTHSQNLESPEYLARIEKHGEQKLAWMIITSLRNTDGLEWEQVNYADPETWTKYEDELLETFTKREVNLIVETVLDANAPSEERQQEALERFFKSRQVATN